MPLPTIDFRSIREHNGAQDEGFEELSYQLIPWLGDISDQPVIRHGAPDGGIEARVCVADGSVWGWQAKYFFQFRDTQFRQMKRSFDSALASWPTLSRYTFVFPSDPPSGQREGTRSAAQKIADEFAKWESVAAQQGRAVTIDYIGGSRLRDILTDEQHAGHVLYWFDQLLLSGDWLGQRLDRAIDAAGPRYTPEVNVDLEIGFVFDGLGRTEAFEERLGEQVAALRRATPSRNFRYDDPQPPRRLRSEVERVTGELHALTRDLGQLSVGGASTIDWTPYIKKADEIERCIEAVLALAERRYWRARSGREPKESPRAQRDSVRNAISRLPQELRALAVLLKSHAARLVVTPSLFLSGAPGTGKTHLLCDMARQRLQAGQPTVLVLGQQLGEGNPRTVILDQLGLPGMSMEHFLAALNAAGEATGTRALLMIDAINEGHGLTTWPAHLRALVSEVALYEHVGLVLSCRSSYVPTMLSQETAGATPETIGFVAVEHPGFADHEWEASATFFEHWGLSAPDFPLLVPEYSNPLFLKLLCQSLSSAGETTLPRGTTGMSRLFEQFLREANRRLSDRDRCNYRAEADPVSDVVMSLAQMMLEENGDWVPYARFEAACDEALPAREWDRSLAKGLLDEGVVARDILGDSEVIRLSYQRLSDHLQAARLIDTANDADLRSFIAELEADGGWGLYGRSGLLEALAVQLPEKRGIELHGLVAARHHPAIREAFLSSIIWRDPAHFESEPLSDYVNAIANDLDGHRDIFVETVLQVACVSGHPFNADRLNDVLSSMPMPHRDAWWTTYINDTWRGTSASWRLIDWARSQQGERADSETARLAAITLSWFLASSNRALRDSATKALVALLRTRVPLLCDLLGQLESVDDLYVAERLYCAAYGCALASNDDSALALLAGAVFDSVFASGRPPAHVLLRDYARGVVETAGQRGALPSRVRPDLARPPYQSPWPVRPPPKEVIERRAPLETHRTLHASLAGTIGDFSRYTVGVAVGHFDAPNQRRRRRQRRDEKDRARQNAAAEVKGSLNANQRALLPIADDDPDRAREFLDSLSQEQRFLLHDAQTTVTPRDRPVAWPTAEASRWIFRRVLDLGWTPDDFGTYDEALQRDSYQRAGPRLERIGKKYQWIALHELLARIADHCPYRPWHGDDTEPYDGPWQLALRDNDPSLTFDPIPVPFYASPRTWWQPLDVQIGRFDDSAERDKWSIGDAGVPTDDDVRRLLQIEGEDGKRWLTLEGRYSWSEVRPAHLRDVFDAKGLLWLQIKSYVVPRRDFADFETWARRQDWFGRWMPEGPELRDVFLGEWPYHPSAGTYADEREDIAPRAGPDESAPSGVTPTWATYTIAEDGSLSESVQRSVPARYLVEAQGLRWRAASFTFVHPDGRVAALDPSAEEHGSSALLYDEALLRELLDTEEVSLVWTVLGEKHVSGSAPRERILVMSGLGTLGSGGAGIEAGMRTRLHP